MALTTINYNALIPSLSRASLHRERDKGLLTEQEREELRAQGVGHMAVNTLEAIAGALDKPGAAVRGTLAGDPWAWLQAVPFSRTAGLADPKDVVYGRDLLAQWGIAPPNKKGFTGHGWDEFLWDVAGLGTEIVTDPLMLLAVGGPTKKGIEQLGKAASLVKGAKAADEAVDSARTLRGAVESLTKAVEHPLETRPGGVMGQTAAQRAGEYARGERALFGIKIPGAGTHLGSVGSGPLVADLYTKLKYGSMKPAAEWGWGDFLAEAVSWPSRYTRGHFRASAKGMTRGAEQFEADRVWAELGNKQAAFHSFARVADQAWRELADVYEHDLARYAKNTGNLRGVQDFERMAAEAMDSADRFRDQFGSLADGIQTLFKDPGSLGEPAAVEGAIASFSDKAAALFDALQTGNDMRAKVYRDLGGRLGEFTDDWYGTAYNPRFTHNPEIIARAKKQGLRPEGKMDPEFEFALARHIRDVPFGRTTINAITQDEAATAVSNIPQAAQDALRKVKPSERAARTAKVRGLWQRKQMRKMRDWLGQNYHGESGLKADSSLREHWTTYVAKRYLEPAAARLGVTPGTPQWERLTKNVTLDEDVFHPLTGKVVGKKGETYGSIADDLFERFKDMPKSVLERGIYDESALRDTFQYRRSLEEAISHAEGLHHFLQGTLLKDAAEEGVWVRDLWGATRLNEQGFMRFVDDAAEARGVEGNFRQRLAAAMDDQEAYQAVQAEFDTFVDTLKVPKATERAVKAYAESYDSRDLPAVVNFIKKFNTLWKGAATTAPVPWPAFHARNIVSAVWQAWADGAVSPSEMVRGMWKYAKDTREYRRTGKTTPLLQELLAAGHEALGVGVAHDVAGRSLGPDKVPKSILESLGTYFKAPPPGVTRGQWENPTRIAGMVEEGAPLSRYGQVGSDIYNAIEGMIRGGHYYSLRPKGFDIGQAVHRVREVQFDYQDLSKFEQAYLKQVIPFYGWLRKNTPRQLAKIAEAPGGRTAQTIRVMERTKQESSEWMPEWMREGGAIRVGGPPEAARHITWTGIPVEDLSRVIGMADKLRPSPGRTMEKVLGQTFPQYQALAETIAGRDVFTGRPLKTLSAPVPGLETMPVLNNLIQTAMPGYRGVTTAKALVRQDQGALQKLLNVLTGVKVITSDLEKAELMEMRDLAQEISQEHPLTRTFTKTYIPADRKAEVTPRLRSALETQERLNQAIVALLERRRRNRPGSS